MIPDPYQRTVEDDSGDELDVRLTKTGYFRISADVPMYTGKMTMAYTRKEVMELIEALTEAVFAYDSICAEDVVR